MTQVPLSAGRPAALIFICLAIAFDAAAQSMSFPVLPRLAEHLLGGDHAAAAAWVGYLEVGWALPQFFAAPIMGLLADRYGRRPIIIASVFGVGFELILCGLAPNVWWLLAGRMLCGFTCGAQAAAFAYLADITPPEERAGRFGLLTAALWSGIVIGPAIGGLLAGWDIKAPFWAAAAIALTNGVYGLFVLPESLPKAGRTPFDWAKASPLGSIDMLVKTGGLLPLAAATLFVWLAVQAKDNMLTLYTAYRYGWTPWTFGVFVTFIAGANLLVQSQLTGRLSRRFGDNRILIAGLALQTTGFAAIALAPTGVWFWIANLPIALAAITMPALQALMSRRVDAAEQGRLQGALGSVSSLASILSPIPLTQLFALAVARGGDPSRFAVTIVLGAVFSGLALAIVAATRRASP